MQTPWRKARPSWLYKSLLQGRLPDAEDEENYAVSLKKLGEVETTGSMVACDPYVGSSTQTLPYTFPVGSYPVWAAISEIGPEHTRCAGLLMVLNGSEVVSWENKGKDDDVPEEDTYYGFPVDAGTGCLAGVEVFTEFERLIEEDDYMQEDALSEQFSDDMEPICAVSPEGLHMVFAESGWGDGFYPVWAGLNAAGKVSVLLVDFNLVNDPFSTHTTAE